jgi:hypothetical protein
LRCGPRRPGRDEQRKLVGYKRRGILLSASDKALHEMQIAYFLLQIAMTVMPGIQPAGEIAPSREPRYLLEQAIGRVEESREPVDDAQYRLLLSLSRDMACFDKSTSVRLLAGAFKTASSTEEQTRRLDRLESLALHASVIDRGLSTDALLALASPDNGQSDLCRELKFLAIRLVLAHGRNAPEEPEITASAEKFCREQERIQKSDVGCDSAYAFAGYVSLLDPELGAGIWTRFRPDLAWNERLSLAEDLVHYAPRSAATELQELLKSAPDEESQIRTLVALYCAGEREIAVTGLAALKPEAIGRGRPLGDLFDRIARADPNLAVELAQKMGPERGVAGAMNIILEAIAATQPGQIERFLSYLDNEYQRAYRLLSAVQSLTTGGDLESAARLAREITVAELRCVAWAVIAESAKDRDMMREALQVAWKEDIYGRSLRSVTACAARAFGAGDFERMLLELLPDLPNRWEDLRLFAILNVVADRDPAWVLGVFKSCRITAPIPEGTILGVPYFELLPKLAPVDAEFMLGYLQEHAKEWDSSTQKSVKKECTESLARGSVAGATQFGQSLGLSGLDINHAYLEGIYRSWQIVKNPARVEQTLGRLGLRNSTSQRPVLLRAVEIMIGWQEDYFRNVEGVLQLADALTDKSLADETLSQGASLLYQLDMDRDAFRLLNRVRSPWSQAKVLESMAYPELFPRPRERISFLQGCWADEETDVSQPGVPAGRRTETK